MASIKFSRFNRVLTRCTEVGTAQDARATVSGIHKDVLGPPLTAFQKAHSAVRKAESTLAKASAASAAALAGFDDVYAEARLVTLAYVPTVKVPDTLKQQPTDTDKADAIQVLLDTLGGDNKAEEWAQNLLKGDFGTQAPGVIEKLSATVAASVILSKARENRAEAYGPAYEKYLAFKKVVRKAYGQSSKEYQRIHLRGQNAQAAEDDAEEPATPEVELDSTG
jgi:hypothetical protein